MASVRNIGLTNEEKKAENERNQASAMPVETSPSTLNKTPPRDSYWFAHGGIEDASKNGQNTSKPPETLDPKEVQLQKDKEERIRIFREQQEEERLKRLKDLEQQFLQAKKHREQQEEERKRRIEEARIKETERRQQVEERKRQIWEAEQERKEAILRRNMEREARIEARRNAQRNSLCFAFGSSTPRTFDLDLAAIGVNRNSASPGSVLMSSVSGRRSEERELGPPRATSACSLDRKFGEDCMSRSMVSLSSAFRGRKRTDITPTLSRERSITPHVTPRGKDTSRSPSRPQSSMSGASEISATSSSISGVNMRTRTAPRRPRPYSIAGSIADRTPTVAPNVVKKEPERQPRITEKNAQPTVPKQPRAKSAGREKNDSETSRPLSAPKKPVPPPKSKEVLARAKSHPVPPVRDNLRKPVKPTIDSIKANFERKIQDKEKNTVEVENHQSKVVTFPVDSKSDNVIEIVNSSPITSPVTDSDMCFSSEDSKAVTESEINTYTQTFTESDDKVEVSEPVEVPSEKQNGYKDIIESENIPEKIEEKPIIVNNSEEIIQQNVSESENTALREMAPQKPRITSEEEARAALAEKRRLAREQAEREAELERQRQEEIRRKEEEQRRLEELEQRRMEEEQMRLAELHRQLEAEKLRKAIEEQQQREKEEQEKREEEARQKAEKEEQEKKAREEAEKQRIELEERLRKEEEERAERKKRVEQIMARTRGKTAQSPVSTPSDNNNKKTEDANSNSSFEIKKSNTFPSVQDSTKANHITNGSAITKIENSSLSTSFTNNYVSSVNPFQISEENMMSNSMPLPDLLNTEFIANHSVKDNGLHVESDEQLVSSKISVSNSFTSNRTLSANNVTSPTQTNGYSSHEDMSCTTSPEETSDGGLLIDVGSSQQNEANNTLNPADFTKLVDIEQSTLNLTNENYLINVDNVNSNILSSEKSYTGFDDCLQKKPDVPPVVDLLS